MDCFLWHPPGRCARDGLQRLQQHFQFHLHLHVDLDLDLDLIDVRYLVDSLHRVGGDDGWLARAALPPPLPTQAPEFRFEVDGLDRSGSIGSSTATVGSGSSGSSASATGSTYGTPGSSRAIADEGGSVGRCGVSLLPAGVLHRKLHGDRRQCDDNDLNCPDSGVCAANYIRVTTYRLTPAPTPR